MGDQTTQGVEATFTRKKGGGAIIFRWRLSPFAVLYCTVPELSGGGPPDYKELSTLGMGGRELHITLLQIAVLS